MSDDNLAEGTKWDFTSTAADAAPAVDVAQSDLHTDIPHIARVYDFWLGGKNNYVADRKLAEAVMAAAPFVTEGVRANRQFLRRAVRLLAAEHGIRQFLDIGTGLPSGENTHEVAQKVAPEARIVYGDNDPSIPWTHIPVRPRSCRTLSAVR